MTLKLAAIARRPHRHAQRRLALDHRRAGPPFCAPPAQRVRRGHGRCRDGHRRRPRAHLPPARGGAIRCASSSTAACASRSTARVLTNAAARRYAPRHSHAHRPQARRAAPARRRRVGPAGPPRRAFPAPRPRATGRARGQLGADRGRRRARRGGAARARRRPALSPHCPEADRRRRRARCSARSASPPCATPAPCACSASRASGTTCWCARCPGEPMPSSRIEDALADIAAGRFVILAEGESGESQLCMAAELVTPDAVNFMATQCRGLVCLSMTEERLRQLGIPLMVPEAPSVVRRSYRRVDRGAPRRHHRHLRARSRHDDPGRDGAGRRARTTSSCPGHVLPIVGRGGGVLVRAGLTEAAIDLVRLSGLPAGRGGVRHPRDDGSLAYAGRPRGAGRAVRAQDRRASPIWWPTACAPNRSCTASPSARVAIRTGGRFHAVVYRNDVDGYEHMALVKGNVAHARRRAGAAALAVPHRRRVRLRALRLRRPARPRPAR